MWENISRAKKPYYVKGYPFIGVATKLKRDPLKFMKTSFSKSGNADIISFKLGRHHAYLARSPEFMKRVLIDNRENYNKMSSFSEIISGSDMTKKFSGRGIEYEFEKEFLKPKNIKLFQKGILTHIHRTQSILSNFKKTGKVVDMTSQMDLLLINIIMDVLFGMNPDKFDASKIRASLIDGGKYIQQRIIGFMNIPLWIPTAGNKKYKQSKQYIEKVILNILFNALDSNSRRSILTDKIKYYRKEIDLGDEEVINDIKTILMVILVASFYTSSSILSTVWYSLFENKEILDLLQKEVRAFTFNDNELTDISDLKVTRAVIDETLRLFPPVWVIPRTVTEDDVISNYQIKKGSLLFLSIISLHHNPIYWEKPLKFNPKRFLGIKYNKFHLVPFGEGLAKCIGRHFAILELVLIVAKLSQNFIFTPLNGDNLEIDVSPFLNKKGGLKMNIVSLDN